MTAFNLIDFTQHANSLLHVYIYGMGHGLCECVVTEGCACLIPFHSDAKKGGWVIE